MINLQRFSDWLYVENNASWIGAIITALCAIIFVFMVYKIFIKKEKK